MEYIESLEGVIRRGTAGYQKTLLKVKHHVQDNRIAFRKWLKVTDASQKRGDELWKKVGGGFTPIWEDCGPDSCKM